MFNSVIRDSDDDPFFSDPFRAHQDHMRQMMRSFSEPFGGSFMPSITDGRSRGHDMVEHPTSTQALRGGNRDMGRSLMPFGSLDNMDVMRNPFNMFDNVMSNMKNRMEGMHRNFENMSTDANAHSFSSSSVMTYSKVGNEPPKVFQASSTTRRAPGGVTETQKSMKDSESGLQKMAIGHHIQDRGHVVEKKYNKKTGEREFMQDFQNLDESEAESFDDEWQQEVSKFQSSGPMSRPEERRLRGVHRAAITAPQQPHRDHSRDEAVGQDDMKSSTKND